MKTAIATLRGVSPYSQSKPHDTEHLEKEAAEAYDTRTWREHLHADSAGTVFIPNGALKNSLSEAAKFLSLQIAGKGKQTYTKHFEAGVMAVKPATLGIKKADVKCERLYVPSNGMRGGGKRVWRTFPVIHSWECTAEFLVLDETITEAVFRKHLEACGSLIGIGRFRPRNNGYYGRFDVLRMEWE